jgi:hypothetical protein
MELKDVILSTLAEMEDDAPIIEESHTEEELATQEPVEVESVYETEDESKIDSELAYLNSIRERLLVLFEGFQAPNNSNIEAKVDMTLNFLEYTLATIDLRVQALEKGNNK